MTHLVEALRMEAEATMAAMRAAALHAREVHARAELMRHVLGTARRVSGKPRDEALGCVVDEWLKAWALDRATWRHVADMERLSLAFYDYVRAPTDANDRAVREACTALERIFASTGMSLADRMAWRSGCAHDWWAQVSPPPAGKGRGDRQWPDRPFWEHGCPARCLEV